MMSQAEISADMMNLRASTKKMVKEETKEKPKLDRSANEAQAIN